MALPAGVDLATPDASSASGGAAGAAQNVLDEARALARSFHRLRRAARLLLQRQWLVAPSAAGAPTAAGVASAPAYTNANADAAAVSSADAAATILADAARDLAKGRTLLTSAPLAALEVKSSPLHASHTVTYVTHRNICHECALRGWRRAVTYGTRRYTRHTLLHTSRVRPSRLASSRYIRLGGRY